MTRRNKNIIFLFLIILVTIFIRIGIGEICTVPTASMEPSVRVGDWIWINKLSYGGKLPERFSDIPILNIFTWIPYLREKDQKNNWGYYRLPGFTSPNLNDIIIFRNPDNPGILLMKRLTHILKKGDRIKITQENYIKINKIITAEGNSMDIRSDSIFINGKYDTEYKISNNYYFMEGDNKNNSWDSRSFGYITDNEIIGKANLIIYSTEKTKSKKFFQKL